MIILLSYIKINDDKNNNIQRIYMLALIIVITII